MKSWPFEYNDAFKSNVIDLAAGTVCGFKLVRICVEAFCAMIQRRCRNRTQSVNNDLHLVQRHREQRRYIIAVQVKHGVRNLVVRAKWSVPVESQDLRRTKLRKQHPNGSPPTAPHQRARELSVNRLARSCHRISPGVKACRSGKAVQSTTDVHCT